ADASLFLTVLKLFSLLALYNVEMLRAESSIAVKTADSLPLGTFIFCRCASSPVFSHNVASASRTFHFQPCLFFVQRFHLPLRLSKIFAVSVFFSPSRKRAVFPLWIVENEDFGRKGD
ncbi:hypothetical protein, partial [uncultured Bilophila sp.]|uniref:hypothetical protein n=1 Tax=uncultured Bilophila sp. TaxID=529385 RepID=UPI00266FFD0B